MVKLIILMMKNMKKEELDKKVFTFLNKKYIIELRYEEVTNMIKLSSKNNYKTKLTNSYLGRGDKV